MTMETTECRSVFESAPPRTDGIVFGFRKGMAPYIPRQRDRRDAWSDLLAALARSLDRRLDVSLMRGAFETALGRVIPVRGVQLREIGSRWGTRVATAVSESVVLEFPGEEPSSAGLLEVTVDPGCRLGAWDFLVLVMAATPGSRVLEL